MAWILQERTEWLRLATGATMVCFYAIHVLPTMQTKINKTGTFAKVFLMSGLACMMVTGACFSYVIGGISASPHADTCYELLADAPNLVIRQCVDYMEVNPGDTGQVLIDHYEPLKSQSLYEWWVKFWKPLKYS